MKKIIKNIVVIFAALIVIGTILAACTYEDLGLPIIKSIDTEESGQETGNDSILSDEELFLQMKARQNKNPLNDINVRKAIFHAVDRERIVREIFNGYNKVNDSIFPEGSELWSPAWSEYDFDLEKAGEFLEKAGFGLENPLYITISAVDNNSSRKLIEDIIKEDLEKIGINLWIYNKTPKEFYQDSVYNGDFDIGIWTLFISGTKELSYSFSSKKIPSMETEENKNCENFYWYSNGKIDDALMYIDTLEDIEVIKERTKEIQETLAKDAVILPFYSRLFVFAHNRNIARVEIRTLEDQIFFEIEDWLLPEDQKTSEGEKSGIIFGYESDNIDIFNGFKPYFINDLLFKGLWKKESDGSYIPELAEGFSGFKDDVNKMVSNNITITLKDGIYWQDGDPITSEDIKYTFEYFKNLMEESEYFSKIDEDHQKIENIEIIDEKNFTIVFKEQVDEWQKLFPQIFKKGQFAQTSYDNLIYSNIISNGPYKIMGYDAPSGQMTLEINEYYFNKIPEIERIIVRFDPDIHNLIAMLKEGGIDFLSIPVDPELMKVLEEENGMSLVIKEGNLIEHLALSLKPMEE